MRLCEAACSTEAASAHRTRRMTQSWGAIHSSSGLADMQVCISAPHEWQLPTRWPPQPVPLQCCERGFSLQGQGQSSIAFFGVTM